MFEVAVSDDSEVSVVAAVGAVPIVTEVVSVAFLICFVASVLTSSGEITCSEILIKFLKIYSIQRVFSLRMS